MPTIPHAPLPFDPTSTEHLPRRRVRLAEELHGPWIGIPEAWRDALSTMPKTAWTVGQRLLELAGKRVARWRWGRTLRELARAVGRFVGCSARTFWRGWKLLRDRGFVIEGDDGWRIATENGSLLLVENMPLVGSARCQSGSAGEGDLGGSSEGDSDGVSASSEEVVPVAPSGEEVGESTRLVNSNHVVVNHEGGDEEISPERQELIDRLWGRTPERLRERREAKRRYEREQFDRQQERNRQRDVVGGQRRGFTHRWRELMQVVRDRWGDEPIRRLAKKGRFKEGQELQKRIADADIRGSDETWSRAVEVIARRREEPGDPFTYFAAVLERLAAEEDEVRPLDDLATAVEVLNVSPECIETQEQRVEVMQRWVEMATKR